MEQGSTKLADVADIKLAQIDAIVEKALKIPKRMIKWLLGVVAGLVIVVGFASYLYLNQVDLNHSVQQQAYTDCIHGNARAATDAQNWDFFIGKLVANDKKPADLAEVRLIEDHIAKADAPIVCTLGK
jgi:hypothetical protein